MTIQPAQGNSMIKFFWKDFQVLCRKVGDGGVWFKGVDVARALGYKDPGKSIRTHVDEFWKKSLGELSSEIKEGETPPFNCPRGVKRPPSNKTIAYISEPAVYQLACTSRLPGAVKFKRWVYEEVLSSIRKTGKYAVVPLMTEEQLHFKLVKYIRRVYPEAMTVAGLGVMQTTSAKRMKSYGMGYKSGQPDLMITNRHERYRGMCIEFKTPRGNGVLSEKQAALLARYNTNGYCVVLSSDYDEIIKEVDEYCVGIRVKCILCKRQFSEEQTLASHEMIYHWVSFPCETLFRRALSIDGEGLHRNSPPTKHHFGAQPVGYFYLWYTLQ